MSSSYVRSQFETYIKSQLSTEKILDLDNQYGELQKFLLANDVSIKDNWMGIQYIPSTEDPISTGGADHGCYREIGAILLHIVAPAKVNVVNNILPRAEAAQASLRGKRLGEMIITSVTPPNFNPGATLEFEGGYLSGTITIGYYRDFNQ